MWPQFKSTEEKERRKLFNYVRRRIADIRALKDFAISNDIAIDTDQLAAIGEITLSDPAARGDQSVPQSELVDESNRCDELYVALSAAIHAYFRKKKESFSLRSIIMVRDHLFFNRLLIASIVILALTVLCWVIINASQFSELIHCGRHSHLSVQFCLGFGLLIRSIFAVVLGCLGALIYLILNVLGFGEDGDTHEFETPSAIKIRIILGGLVGWLAFVAMLDFPGVTQLLNPSASEIAGEAQAQIKPTSDPGALKFFLAFIAGFSTRLVVGVLGKMVSTVAQALGLAGIDRPGKT